MAKRHTLYLTGEQQDTLCKLRENGKQESNPPLAREVMRLLNKKQSKG